MLLPAVLGSSSFHLSRYPRPALPSCLSFSDTQQTKCLFLILPPSHTEGPAHPPAGLNSCWLGDPGLPGAACPCGIPWMLRDHPLSSSAPSQSSPVGSLNSSTPSCILCSPKSQKYPVCQRQLLSQSLTPRNNPTDPSCCARLLLGLPSVGQSPEIRMLPSQGGTMESAASSGANLLFWELPMAKFNPVGAKVHSTTWASFPTIFAFPSPLLFPIPTPKKKKIK